MFIDVFDVSFFLRDLMDYFSGIKNMGNLSKAEIAEMWASLSSVEQNNIAAEHEMKLDEYSITYESFVRVSNLQLYLVI